MRSNFLLDNVLNTPAKPKPALESEQTPQIQVADTVTVTDKQGADLLPIEDKSAEEQKDILLDQLNNIPPGELNDLPDPAMMMGDAERSRRLTEAFEDFDSTDSMMGGAFQAEITYDQMKAHLAKANDFTPIGGSYKEVVNIVDIADRVDGTGNSVDDMENAGPLKPTDTDFINLSLESFGRELQLDVPRYQVQQGKVTLESRQAVKQFGEGLKRFALTTYKSWNLTQ